MTVMPCGNCGKFVKDNIFGTACEHCGWKVGQGITIACAPSAVSAGYIPAGGEMSHINRMFEAYRWLKSNGWNDICYCPKDGTYFLAIEAGSTGVHKCVYDGVWPDGRWWILEDGDMSPSMPILWKPEGI